MTRADHVEVIPFKGERLGVHICEDAWTDAALSASRQLYTLRSGGRAWPARAPRC